VLEVSGVGFGQHSREVQVRVLTRPLHNGGFLVEVWGASRAPIQVDVAFRLTPLVLQNVA
jgi:hypothetical protein